MKIFNWVHRKFNLKDGLAQNAKKTGVVADEINDVWKGGILTIGTFGYDPLPKDHDDVEQNDHAPFYALQKQEAMGQISSLEIEKTLHQITDYVADDDDDEEDEEVDDDEDEEEDQEVNPLVHHAAYVHRYEGEMEIEGHGNRDDEFGAVNEISETVAKKERTTLAELFNADSKESGKKGETSTTVMMMKEKMNEKHKRRSFAKKLIGEDAPIQKLHGLMRRMLKKKIHPDLDLNKQIQADSKVVGKNSQGSTTTSALLPTKDATMI